MLLFLGAPSAAADRPGPGLNTLSDLKVVPTGAGTQVVVVGDRQPTFTVFRLSEPDRLVVDLSSADASGIKGHHEGQGPVAGVVASQFTDARASVGRVLVALSGASQYDVRADGNRVVISVEGGTVAKAPEAPKPMQVAKVEPPKAPAPAPASVMAPSPTVVAKAEPPSTAAAAPKAPAPMMAPSPTVVAKAEPPSTVAAAPKAPAPAMAPSPAVVAKAEPLNTTPAPKAPALAMAPSPTVVAKAEPLAATPAPAMAPSPTVVAKAEPPPTAVVAPKMAPKPVEVAKAEPPAAEEPSSPKPENVVAAEVDEQEVKNPASRITGLTLSRDTLRIGTNGEVAKFELLELADPPRLALDVYGVGLSARAPRTRSAHVKDVRVGAHADKVRVVVDVQGGMPAYKAVRAGQGLELRLAAAAAPRTPAEAVAAKKASPPVSEGEIGEIEVDGKRMSLAQLEEARPMPVEVAPIKPTPEPAAPPAAPKVAQVKPVDVKDLSFHESGVGGRIEIKLSGATSTKVERPDPGTAVLTFGPASLPKRLERSLDTSALGTPVKMVSAFPIPGEGQRVRVVVASSGELSEDLSGTTAGLTWKLSVKAAPAETVAVAAKTAGFTAEADTYAALGAPRQRRYSGKRVSFEFKDIDIHNLLRVIAEVSKKNVVVADDVTGRVTIRLRNVPWDQALELILRSKSLGKEEIGNIIRVAPLKTLEEEAKLRAERKKALQTQEELVVRLIPVNYAIADQMKDRVKDVLTDRGTVTTDVRTNVLIVKDVASNIARANTLVQSLDTPTPQVLIESRIVEANSNYTRQLGVQWGGLGQMAPGTGNPTGLVFPNTVAIRGGSSPDGNGGTGNPPNFAVNLPAAVGAGAGGALGFIFGSVGGAIALNLRLSALENQGTVKTISAPKITTLDNNTARISQGVSLPFSQVSAQGVNTSFVEARLSLEVTPHITQDGSILMAIRAENNQPDPSNTGANGQPAIQRKEANTQVLVKDGDTTVIGGIYVRRGSVQNNGLPILSHIPVLGFFFRNDSEVDQRQELLIFITPRIINRTTIAQSL
ncbi:MAG TPA: type IV pilus secretin PilQ [Myxococcaceae bacterium]